jgi:hypothetical protein
MRIIKGFKTLHEAKVLLATLEKPEEYEVLEILDDFMSHTPQRLAYAVIRKGADL